MKKIIFLLVTILFCLASCEPSPTEKYDIEITDVLNITANYPAESENDCGCGAALLFNLKIIPFEYKEHNYIIVAGGDCMNSIIHDPECEKKDLGVKKTEEESLYDYLHY